MLIAAPPKKPELASNVAACTLNSSTTPGGGEYAICVPCMFGAPSIMNWLLPERVPSMDIVDGELVSNGRTYPADSGVKITPGESVAIVTTIPSFRGSSLIVRLSTTCPNDAEEVSSRGASAFTSTVCVAGPSSSATFTETWSLTRSTTPLRVEVLKPGCSTRMV